VRGRTGNQLLESVHKACLAVMVGAHLVHCAHPLVVKPGAFETVFGILKIRECGWVDFAFIAVEDPHPLGAPQARSLLGPGSGERLGNRISDDMAQLFQGPVFGLAQEVSDPDDLLCLHQKLQKRLELSALGCLDALSMPVVDRNAIMYQKSE
jgi:hypothetical protein